MPARFPHPPVMTLLLALVLASCASGTGGSSGGNPDVLTMEELATVQSSNVYEAVQQLRPRWLRARDARETVRVVVNGAPQGSVEELRGISLGTVESLRYRDAREATMRYGTGFGGGAIEVTTR